MKGPARDGNANSTHEAQQRQQMVLDVLGGRRTATEAAKTLGISRKNYHRWQERALAGMRQALEEQPAGRPVKANDPEKDALEREVLALRKEKTALEARVKIQSCMRQVIDEMLGKNPEAKKKQG